MIITILLMLTLLITLTYSLLLVHQGSIIGLALSLLCLSAILLVILPERATEVANILGVGRGADLLLYFCFMSGSIIFLLIHVRIRKQNYMITKIVREIAIASASKPDRRILRQGVEPRS